MCKIEIDVKEYQKLKERECFLKEILGILIFYENPDRVLETIDVSGKHQTDEDGDVKLNNIDYKGEILYHLKCINWKEKLQTDFHTTIEEYLHDLKYKIDLMKDISEEVRRKKVGLY